MALVLNTPRFYIYQSTEYTRVLNMPGFWICQATEYTWVTQASECAWISLVNSWICLIMSEYATMFNTNSTFLQPVSLRSQFAIFEKSAKKNLHYFHKMLYRRCLTGLWICLRSWIYQGFEYTRVLNMSGFWIYQGSEYPWIIPEYAWLYLNMPQCSTLIRPSCDRSC